MLPDPSRGSARQDPSSPAGRRKSARLLITVDRSDDPSCCRLTLAGELDANTAGKLHLAVTEVLRQQNWRRIELNVRGVPFLDAAGIRTLAICHAEAGGRACRMTLTHPHPWVYRIMRSTGLIDHFGLT